LVQDDEDVFTTLLEQLVVEQRAFLGSIAALVEAHVLGALWHVVHLFSLQEFAGMGHQKKPIEFDRNQGIKKHTNSPTLIRGVSRSVRERRMIVHNCVCFLQPSPTRSWFRTLGKLRTRGFVRGSAPTTDCSECHP